MNESLIAYAAGIFDGEGSVSILRHSGRHYSLRVDVCNTDPRLMTWFRENFGGAVRTRENNGLGRLPIFNWQLNSRDAAAFLRIIRPYLIVKGDKADVGIAFMAIRDARRGTNVRISGDEIERQSAAHRQMRGLNGGRGAA